mgnify:CR=1 FL=1
MRYQHQHTYTHECTNTCTHALKRTRTPHIHTNMLATVMAVINSHLIYEPPAMLS